MSLNHRQRHQLYRMEGRLFRSDPQLAARLSMFGRLCAGQAMPALFEPRTAHRLGAGNADSLVRDRAAAIAVRLGVEQGGQHSVPRR